MKNALSLSAKAGVAFSVVMIAGFGKVALDMRGAWGQIVGPDPVWATALQANAFHDQLEAQMVWILLQTTWLTVFAIVGLVCLMWARRNMQKRSLNWAMLSGRFSRSVVPHAMSARRRLATWAR